MQRVKRQAHARGCAGCQILHQHISLRQQLFKNWACIRVLQIERQAFFRTIGPDKMRSHSARALIVLTCKVANTWALDLNHTRTHVCKLTRTKGRCNRVFKADDGDAF